MVSNIQHPDSIEDLLLEVRVYLKYGLPEEAEKSLHKAIDLKPQSIEPHLLLAELYESMAKKEKQVAELQHVTQILLDQGANDNALSYFKKILEIDPEHDEALNFVNSYKVEIKTNKTQSSSSGLKLESSDDGSSGKIVLKELFDDLEDVTVDETENLKKNPFEDAKLEMKAGRISEAISLFQKSIRDPIYEADSCLFLGQCFLKENHFSLAIRFFQKGLSYPLKQPEYYRELRYSLAVAEEKKGNVKNAIKLYKEVVSDNPAYKDTVSRLHKLEKEFS